MHTNVSLKMAPHVIAYVGLDVEEALAAAAAFRAIHAQVEYSRTPVSGSEKQILWHYTVIASGQPQAALEKVWKEIN
jgi:hypothetical protein